jgi:hypothetical protein
MMEVIIIERPVDPQEILGLVDVPLPRPEDE